MPKLDPATLEISNADEYFKTYFTSPYIFHNMTKNILSRFDVIDDPVNFARVIQLAKRPVWSVERAWGQGTESFVDMLHRSLQKVGADLVLHTKHGDRHPIAANIHFSHHTYGKKLNTWHYKMAYLPHMFHVDRNGYSGWSSLRQETPQSLAKLPDGHVNCFFDNVVIKDRDARITKYKQLAGPAVLPENFIFVPFQVYNDSVIDLCFKEDYIAFARELIMCVIEEGHTVVYKLHPFGENRLIEEMLASIASDRLIATQASIHEILPRAEAVLTANSGVGFEALTYLKPVFCFAKADYAVAGRDILSADDLRSALRQLTAPVDQDRIKRVLYAAMRRHQVDVRSIDAMDRQVLRVLCEHYLEQH